MGSEPAAPCPPPNSGRRRSIRSPGPLLALAFFGALLVVLAASASVADAAPTYGAYFGTTGGTSGPRAISIPAFSFGSPLSIDFWVKIGSNQAAPARLVDFGNPESVATSSNVDSLVVKLCPANAAECSALTTANKHALSVELYQGTTRLQAFALLTGSPIDLATWTHVVITWAANGDVISYKNGALVETVSKTGVPTATRSRNFLGRPNEWGKPYVTDATAAHFRLWKSVLSASDVTASFGMSSPPALPMYVFFTFEDCNTRGVSASAVDGSTNNLHAALVDDVALLCPGSPPAAGSGMTTPAILTASASSPVSVALTANYSSGQGVTSLEARCSGFGGPFVASLASPTNPAGSYMTVAVAASYAGGYRVSCAVLSRNASGAASSLSAAVYVAVPAGVSLSAQTALMPSGKTQQSNTFLRVGNSVASEENQEVVFVAPLPNYILGQRAASHRLGIISRTRADYYFCDYDLDACRCTLLRKLSGDGPYALGSVRPTEFTYTSMSPWPARDPDSRFNPSLHTDTVENVANWPWSDYAYDRRKELLGDIAGEVLKKQADCDAYGCYTYAAQRFAAYVYSACNPGAYGSIRPWPSDLCSSATAYDFMTVAAAVVGSKFKHDFRHFYASYERHFYEAVSGLSSAAASEKYDWSGFLGTFHFFRPTPTGSNTNMDEYKRRGFRLLPELLNYAYSRPDADPESNAGDSNSIAFGSHYFFSATNCLDFYDAEPASRTFEGFQTSYDVATAYNGQAYATHSALLMHDLRYFSFWQRGVAFFGSFVAFVGTPATPTVVPLIKACSLPLGVSLLKPDTASLGNLDASAIFKRVAWPGDPGSSFADSYPPGASVIAVANDGRVAAGGSRKFFAILRIPTFPAANTPCPTALVGGTICASLSVTHTTAVYAWDLVQGTSKTPQILSKNATFPLPASYYESVIASSSRTVLRTDVIPLSDHWIVMNERPLHAGMGHGYLEGRWVDPPNSKFAFYVTGDQITRLTKANSYQTGMNQAGGSTPATIQIYGNVGFVGSLANWTSVAAAVYKDGTLYVVQELHTPANTRVFTFASDAEPRPRLISGKRMRRSNERAPGSRLLRIKNVDAASFVASSAGGTVSVDVIVPNFPANVLSAHVVDDFSSTKMFGFGADSLDPAMAFSELAWVVFIVSDPPTVIKLHHRCPPGQRWNWEAAVFNRSVANSDLCINLPAGRYSAAEGLLLDTDAQPCDPGKFSSAGATACTTCQKGTYADGGASSCYDCPQHTYSTSDGQACTPCSPERFTASSRWTFDCVPCPAGNFLKAPRESSCLACPADRYSGYGSVYRCNLCDKGYYPTSDRTRCEQCGEGEYAPDWTCTSNVTTPALAVANVTYVNVTGGICPVDDVRVPECARCPPGTWSYAGTSTNCSFCKAGEVPNDRQSGCESCRPGYSSNVGDGVCFLCPTDFFGNTTTGRCDRCGPGLYSLSDRLRCLPCPTGTYEARPGECERCPINSISNDAVNGVTNCTLCPPGQYSSTDLTQCFECYPGQYRSANMSFCTTVDPGYVAGRGSWNQTKCGNGTVPNFARSFCVACSKGTYKDPAGVICRGCPLNTVTSSEGLDACVPCPAGQVSAPDFQKCQPCSAGTFRSAGMDFCTPVPYRAAALSGSANYQACSNGSVPNMGRSECVRCPKGTYSEGEECVQCPLNTIASDEGTAVCSPCPPGQVAAADLQTCIPCAGGTYRSARNSTCLPVPARAAAASGQAAPTYCDPGKVPNGPKTDCTACRKGTFQRGDLCQTCPLNTISSVDAAAVCTPCANGTVAAADSQTCIPCGMGTYRSDVNATCIPVPPRCTALQGSPMYTVCGPGLVPNVAKSECVPCRAGTYQVEDACQPCPLNHVAPTPGHAACVKCSEGQVAAADSQTCLPCMGGLYRYDPLPTCLRVPSGAVAMPGSRNYTVCGPGTVPNPETTSCTRCGKGTYERGGKCRECIGNTYAPESGMTACRECDAGSVASFDRQGCNPCPSGSARSATQSSCQTCPDRYFSNAPGRAECQPCPAGTESSPDRVECILCRSGSFERNGTCIICPDGTVSQIGETKCRPCTPGYISNAERSECSPCAIGTFKPKAINLCLLCRPGTYAPAGTPDECLKCDPGYFPSADQGRCIACDPGFFMPNGTLTCLRCPWNHYAPKAGTPSKCEECPAGYTSAPDYRSCQPCPMGFFRTQGANSTSCELCPSGTVARKPGSAACEPCPDGQVPREDRADCKNCDGGLVPVNGSCSKCPPKSISAAGDATCGSCPPGHVATASRLKCEPCPAAMYLPASSDVCLKCPRNTIAFAGSSACTPCADGQVSDESQTKCAVCESGSYRNSSMSYCEACPAQTFAPNDGAGECKPCSETQICPAGTTEPVDIGDLQTWIQEAIEQTVTDMATAAQGAAATTPATGGVRRRLMAVVDGARRLLAVARKAVNFVPSDIVLTTDSVQYDTNSANITRAAMPTEETAKKQLYRVMTFIGIGVGAGMIVLGLGILLYLVTVKEEERRSARAARVAKLDMLYTDVITENTEALEAAAKKAALEQEKAAALAKGVTEKEWKKLVKEREAAEEEAKAAEEEEKNNKTVMGAVFTIIGVGFVIVAVCFVLLQFVLANYQIIQSLLPGSSPSVGQISGPFELSASFRGFSGGADACVAKQVAFASLAYDAAAGPADNAGAYLDVVGISPVDGEAAPTFSASYSPASRSCFVVWRCNKCRMTAATNVSVDFRLVSRMAFAVAINYVVRIPNYFSIVGVVTTSAESKLSVFRGTTPVRIPTSLTPIHFENSKDGEPRYDGALNPADNRAAERDAMNFGLCSMTLPLLHSTCAGEMVGLRAAFDLSTVYLLVSRVILATALDMLADLAALGGAAVGVGAQLVVAYFYFKKGKQVARKIKTRVKGGPAAAQPAEEKRKADKGKGPAEPRLPPAPPPLSSTTGPIITAPAEAPVVFRRPAASLASGSVAGAGSAAGGASVAGPSAAPSVAGSGRPLPEDAVETRPSSETQSQDGGSSRASGSSRVKKAKGAQQPPVVNL